MDWVGRIGRFTLKLASGLIALLALVLLLAVGGLYVATYFSARGGEDMLEGEPLVARRPDSAPHRSAEAPSQILFGDLHVHTNYSADSFLQSYQIPNLDPRRTPADACDFARFCSQLDFWSINDHAESLTPTHWQSTIEAIRSCERAAGDASNPDMVSFLGWEWSHSGTAEEHYGHKNVVLADLEDNAIPARPIASGPTSTYMFVGLGTLGVLATESAFTDFGSFHRYALDALAVDTCAEGVASPDLPTDCREHAATPAELFKKLDEWGKRALVIPHGLAWGVTNPAHARLDRQLEQHNPRWQRLIEVYSGHGNSEVFRDFERPVKDQAGRYSCPAPTEDIEFCCHRAGELARARCEDPESIDCDAAMEDAVQRGASIDSGAIALLRPHDIIPGSTDADWGQCSQLQGEYLSAWSYRPKQSAQFAYALDSVEGRPVSDRYRMGMIASSDTHRGRPGTGYKEFGRLVMTDGVGYPLPSGTFDDRQGSFYFSGGLAAVHARGRDREAVWDALSRRETYATSGDRILLWFDHIDAREQRWPMGSEVKVAVAVAADAEVDPKRDAEADAERGAAASPPRFEARALGAQRQQPGCPDFVHDALPADRIASLCRNECHHPDEGRKRIIRLEVVRITPSSVAPDSTAGSTVATIAERIEDPWRVFECAPEEEGCSAVFEDPDASSGTPVERVYYVRAIQEPSPTINGDSTKPCLTPDPNRPEDCLNPASERAWSSPIFMRPAAL